MTTQSLVPIPSEPTARRWRSRVAGALVAALGLSAVGIAIPAQAAVSPAAPVVINEVYGGGGNGSAVLNRDFIELRNTSGGVVDLGSWSVQYAGPTGSSWQVTPLAGQTLQPGENLLVGEAFGSNTGLPGFDADVDGSISMGAERGKVALVSDTTPLTVGAGAAALPQVIDFVGWGTATDFAGAAAPATSVTASIARDASGSNTANNAADFAAGSPTPTGTDSGGDPDPSPSPTGSESPSPSPSPTGDPEEPTVVTIAEIQGTGDASPLAGQAVTTEGVVTAHYPTGGFNGYVIQTPGTGGAIDLATHTASDAVFVYAPGAVGEVALGDTVRVSGQVTEFYGLTEITVAAGGAEVIADAAAPTAATVGWTTDIAQREALESMLVQPQGDYTVSNTYNINSYGEVPLATGTTPLRQKTDVARPGTAEAAAVDADNAARAVTLDDGSSTGFGFTNNTLTPPYISTTEPVIVGASVTFDEPVILDYRNDTWKLNPTRHIVGDGTGNDGVTFENTRTTEPEPVGGDLSVASFNVLNYFTTLGDEDSATCDAYRDRAGDPITVDGPKTNQVVCDQRGAWEQEDFERQQAKIVSAIEGLDASVVGLMEIENSAALGEQADEAVSTLVDALNDAAGSEKWAFVPSSSELPDPSTRDVITNAIIYQPALAQRVGDSRALGTESDNNEAFGNAREPIGQIFEPADGGEPFLFVVNHFKSKGSAGPWPGDADTGDGQGASNESRVRQATALRDWIPTVQGDTESVVLVGDFNSYGQEDPLQVLYGAGYVDAEGSFDLGESSYSYQGLSGSLDHVLLNEAARSRATGADIWNINSGEALYLEYSRFNYFPTLFDQKGPYRSSDHDPVKVGLAAGAQAPVDIDILTINDFHGRLEANTSDGTAGAAVVAGAVKAHEAENPNTLFVSAGDNIGASTFTSLIQQDNPTIDTLVEMGLDVSAVGNHEFDRGFDDLFDRVIPRFGGNTDPGNVTDAQRALGEAYGLGANVYEQGTENPILPEYAIKDVDGVRVAFIGTVTQDTARMVDPAGIEGIEFGDQLEAANRVAAELTDGGLADVIVLLTHSGADRSSDCAAVADTSTSFGGLVTGASPEIDAIVSAHTHQTYACEVPINGADGRTRPVIQASEYGKAMGRLELSVDPISGDLLSITGSTFPLAGAYPADPAIDAKVKAYAAEADVIGAEPIGKISGDILRGGTPPGSDRGVESSMGNWVADVYLWAASNDSYTGTPAQIALMNPGGLRADLLYGDDGVVTYKEAALVQPFANTLVTVTLTGAQIQQILEQQWQLEGDRRKLHLGVSEGFSYEYVETGPRSGRVLSMTFQGEPIGAEDTFTVVTNSFLANGGDGFVTFQEGTDRTDTGQVDLDATLAYFEAFETVNPAPVGRAVATTSEPGTPGGENPATPGGVAPNGSWATVTVSPIPVEQGGTLTVTVSDLEPGQQIAATLFSDPITVTGIPAADASGRTSFTIAIPADFDLGTHTLVVTTAGESPIEVSLTVVARGVLAATGAEMPFGLAFGAAFLLVAAGMVLVLRRRTPVSR